MAPRTRYAKAPGGVSIAYQVVGDGPRDLVWVPGWIPYRSGLGRANDGALVRTARHVFQDRGSHVLKGVPHEWQLFAAQAT